MTAVQAWPIEILGHNGNLYLFRDGLGRTHALTCYEREVGECRFELAGGVIVQLFNRAALETLFAKDPSWPREAWPRRDPYCEPDRRRPIRRFDTDQVRAALISACCDAGFYTPWRGWTD